jgi:hypothetical protein
VTDRYQSTTLRLLPAGATVAGWDIFLPLDHSALSRRVEEAREKLPELIGLVERGELITITRDGIPVADLVRSKAESKAEKSGLDPRSGV